jgi:hypothetical protein
MIMTDDDYDRVQAANTTVKEIYRLPHCRCAVCWYPTLLLHAAASADKLAHLCTVLLPVLYQCQRHALVQVVDIHTDVALERVDRAVLLQGVKTSEHMLQQSTAYWIARTSCQKCIM